MKKILYMGSSLNIVRHPYKQDLKKEPNLENYP